jgi:4-hydroxybenzoate polyprenyltransferase
MKLLKSLFWSSRPVSWVNTAFPFFAAYLFATDSIDSNLIIGSFFFLIPYNLLMYGINDVFDYESDLRNPRKGGIEGALLDPKYHLPTIWVASILAGTFLVYLLLISSPQAIVVLLISVFSVLAYSVPKLRFKEIPFLDSLTSALHFLTPMLFGLTLAGVNLFEVRIGSMILAFLGWGMASHAFGAVQDVRADREAGIKSIATAIGARATVRLAFGLYVLAAIVVLNAGWPGALATVAVIPYLIILFPHLNISDEQCELANRGWRKFIWLNFLAGAIVSLLLINYKQSL